MALTREEVLKVAKLSKLEFNEKEIAVLQEDLNDVMDFISILDEADVEGIEAMSEVNELENVFREDTIKESLETEVALKNAPDSSDGIFIVPRTVGEN